MLHVVARAQRSGRPPSGSRSGMQNSAEAHPSQPGPHCDGSHTRALGHVTPSPASAVGVHSNPGCGPGPPVSPSMHPASCASATRVSATAVSVTGPSVTTVSVTAVSGRASVAASGALCDEHPAERYTVYTNVPGSFSVRTVAS
jgi:hypothetical protein